MLMNFLALEEGKPTRMHFSDLYRVQRRIFDRELGIFKEVDSRVFFVDRLEGQPAGRTFSVLSQKLMAQLEPFVEGNRFMEYEFIITKEGSGFSTEYRVQPIRVTVERLAELSGGAAPGGS